ncbi:MAG: hypothetical protein GF320_04095 [Armatimonadia bacterium]|nr:hypothetical protein [Armatimonadia bacterium]
MSKYASETEVSVDRSEAEIKRTLLRYGADDIVTGHSTRQGAAFVRFFYRDLHIRISMPLPSPEEDRFTKTDKGRRRTATQARREYEKATRQQWRVLLLLLKAKLEAVENELLPEREMFMPWILLPSGRTVFEEADPGLSRWIETGEQPKMLPFSSEGGQA